MRLLRLWAWFEWGPGAGDEFVCNIVGEDSATVRRDKHLRGFDGVVKLNDGKLKYTLIQRLQR